MAEAKCHEVKKARAFLKSAGLLNTSRVIHGTEREQVMTMLRLIGPGQESNNQHLWVESWKVGNVTYDHVTGSGIDELVEIIEDDFQSH